MFDRYAEGVEVIPAATDYEAITHCCRPLEFKDFLPSADGLQFNSYMFKEWIGYFGYKYLREKR